MQVENKHIVVFGLGRIGLPTAIRFEPGNQVTAVDSNAKTLLLLKNGQLPFDEPELKTYFERTEAITYVPVLENDADIFVVAVPTHAGQTLSTDIVFEVVEQIASVSNGGDVLIMSTVPPGTTAEISNRLPEHSVYYTPERMRPGFAIADLTHEARLVGLTKTTVAPDWLQATAYADSAAVEAAKIVENSFRDINVAFANAAANALHDMGLDAAKVFELANSHSRVNVHTPGLGAGGFCLPKATHALAAVSDSALFRIARETNERQIDRVVVRLKTLDVKRVALWGVAYKGDIDIDSNSPARALEQRLTEVDIATSVWDPVIGIGTCQASLSDADAIVIGCAHKAFARLDPSSISDPRPIVDFFGVLDHAKWQSSGFYCIPR